VTSRLSVRRADAGDAEVLAPLFDGYRVFYGRAPDLGLASRFLEQRLRAGESVVFIAEDDLRPAGFVQLYPSFDSVEAGAVWILHDLFVDPGRRGAGIGMALMQAARELAAETGAVGIRLATATDNTAAQALYERLGYRRDDRFFHYHLDARAAEDPDD
jgi:ribosomal protein S18 acetylase RimI-like enzyme